MARSYLLTILLASCAHARAYGVPGGTQRSPDLPLPLSQHDVDRALLTLDNRTPPPRGWAPEEAAELAANITPENRAKFAPLLTALTSTTPSGLELDRTGRVGSLFDSKGADDEALDARFRGDILVGDLRVAKKGDYLFVFYRRYPDRSKDQACPKNNYCRLVIFREVAARRD